MPESAVRFLHQMLWRLFVLLTAGAASSQIVHGEVASAFASVGKLHVPGQRYEKGYVKHYDESCSATLVTDDPKAQSSVLVVSAWHCLEFYRDTSKPLSFETVSGELRTANLLGSGGSMYSDWALLRLNAPLPFPALLASADSEQTDRLHMVGYPRSTVRQSVLELRVFDCHVTGFDGNDIRSDCVLQKGASGGAVFSNTQKRQPKYLGVISRGDGESQSIYVPLARFRSNISAYRQSHQLR